MVKFLFLLLFIQTTPRYLFIGDSITSFEKGYQSKVCLHYQASFINLAEGGKRTDWMLKTVTTHLLKDSIYDKLYIYGGLNDMFSVTKIDSAVNNIQKIVDLANRKNITPIVIIGYDTDSTIKNTWIKDKKLEKEKVQRYILYQNKLKKIKHAKIVNIIPFTYNDTFDGIHPTKHGHMKIAKFIIQSGF